MHFSPLPVYKISATGNDFLLIDLISASQGELWSKNFAQTARAEWTRRWCDRHEGLGADGAVFIESHATADFAWDFYNSDGGNAEMCGNAARAVCLYAYLEHGKRELCFVTRVGEVRGIVHTPLDIEVALPPVLEAEWNVNGAGQVYDFVRAGVPHAVVTLADLKNRPAMRGVADKVKGQPHFLASGVNVTFLRKMTDSQIESVTFERGVEDFTLSCGTGAVAAAYALVRGKPKQKIEVQVPGGRLSVLWKDGQPWLRGPAKVVAKLHLMTEAECP